MCIITADHSGDAIAARLASALLRRGPLELYGAGGQAMAEAGVELLDDTTKWSVLGVTGWLPAILPGILAVWRLRLKLFRRRPDLLVCIDSGGFCIAVARALRWLGGQRVLYYIPPKSWSHKWRAKPLREADYIAAPFPWNTDGDDGSGRVRFVGHPASDLAAMLPPPKEQREALGLDPSRPTVALLPGSRSFELRLNIPALVEAAGLIRAELPDAQFVLSRSASASAQRFAAAAEEIGGEGCAVTTGAAPALRAADFGLVCMGTATLEACALGVPCLAFYRGTLAHKIEYKLRPPKTAFLSLPNLLAGAGVIEERLQDEASPQQLAQRAIDFLTDAALRESLAARLRSVAETLGGPGAAERAATAVLDALHGTWHAATPSTQAVTP